MSLRTQERWVETPSELGDLALRDETDPNQSEETRSFTYQKE